MATLDELKAKLKLIIDEYKVVAAEKTKQFSKANKPKKPIERNYYYLVEDSIATKNSEGQWVAKRTITAKKNETRLMPDCYKNIYNENLDEKGNPVLNEEGGNGDFSTESKHAQDKNVSHLVEQLRASKQISITVELVWAIAVPECSEFEFQITDIGEPVFLNNMLCTQRKIEYNPCFRQQGFNYIDVYKTAVVIVVSAHTPKYTFQTITKPYAEFISSIQKSEETEKNIQNFRNAKQAGVQTMDICWTVTLQSLLRLEFPIWDEDLNTEGLEPLLENNPKGADAFKALKSEPNVFLITHDFDSNPEIYGNVLRVVSKLGIDVPSKQMDGVMTKAKINSELNNPYNDKKSACFEILRVIIQ